MASAKFGYKVINEFLQKIQSDEDKNFLSRINKNFITKIHKIYLLPETQGKGIGKSVIESIGKLAVENNSSSLFLNVNRFNKALHFYEKTGFKIIDEVDIEIGNDYLMEDYVMEKRL